MNTPYHLQEYANKARETAIYPEACRFTYPALGLAGEWGEVMDELHPGPGLTAPRWKWMRELGDLLWYVVNAAFDVDLNLHDLAAAVTGGLRSDTFEALCFQRLTRHDRRDPFLKITVAIGQVAEVAKKAIRDGYAEQLPLGKKSIVASALVAILAGICELCDKYDLSLDEIAAINNQKLLDRKERGKIQGDGSER